MDFMTHLVQWFIYYGSFIFSPHHSPTFLLGSSSHFYLQTHTHTNNNEQRTYPLKFLSYEPSQTHSMSGWWLSHPSEKYESVGIIIPNWMEKNVPNHKPVFNLQVDLPFRCHQTWLAGKILELNGVFFSLGKSSNSVVDFPACHVWVPKGHFTINHH